MIAYVCYLKTNRHLVISGSCAASAGANTASLVDPCRLPKRPTHVQPHTRAFARRQESWASRRPPPTCAWKYLPGGNLVEVAMFFGRVPHDVPMVLHDLLMIFQPENSFTNIFHSPETKSNPCCPWCNSCNVIPLTFPLMWTQKWFLRGLFRIGAMRAMVWWASPKCSSPNGSCWCSTPHHLQIIKN